MNIPGPCIISLRQAYGLTGVMNRRDQREDIFRDDEDRQRFLSTLGKACGKTDWQVHAYCLMRNDGRTTAQRVRNLPCSKPSGW